jgi:ketosteroid isomerase-like protein
MVVAVALAASPAEPAPELRASTVDVEAHGDGVGLATADDHGVHPGDAVRPKKRGDGLSGRRRFVVASAGAGSQPTGRTGMDEAMRGIEALRRRDEAASKAYDVKALAELWTADAVALPPGGPVKRGPELRRGLEKMAEVARGTEVLEYREVFEETLVFGDTAVEWGHIEGSERDRSTGKVTTSRFHLMRILKRVEDGSWRVHRSIFAPAG